MLAWIRWLCLVGLMSWAQAATVVIEAESFAREGGGEVKRLKGRPATSGDLCVIGHNAAGHWLEWDVQIPTTGHYQLVLRYAGGRDWAVYRQLQIDGRIPHPALREFALGSSGGFGRKSEDWINKVLTDQHGRTLLLHLPRGHHVLRLTNLGGPDPQQARFDGAANLDVLALLPPRLNPEQALAIQLPPPEATVLPDPREADQPLAQSSLRRFHLESRLLQRRLRLQVWLPQGYSNQRTYPVLYLLHGFGGDHESWMLGMGVDQRADALLQAGKIEPLIIVAPTIERSYGMNTSSDAQIIGDGPDQMEIGPYEDYFLQEVIPYVERYFSVDTRREGRRIGGVSMGGFAALHLALRHPDLFSRIGAHSPAVMALNYPNLVFYPDAAAIEARHPFALARRFQPEGQRFFIDCGEQDALLPGGRELASLLQARGADVQFFSAPGQHKNTYWTQHIDAYLQFYAGRAP